MISNRRIVKKWEISGLLDNKSFDEKLTLSKNLEKAQAILQNNNYLLQFEEMVYPLIVRLTKKQDIFDVDLAINAFHSQFVINGYELIDIEGMIKYLDCFVEEYKF